MVERFPVSAAALALILSLGGCCEESARPAAIDAVDAEFKSGFQHVWEAEGTRIVRSTPDEAFRAIKKGLTPYGYRVEVEDAVTGALTLVGPAPAPLTSAEWEAASAADLPRFRAIIGEHCGFIAGQLASFQTEGVEIIIYVTALENAPYVELTASMRMRSDRLDDAAGYPRRAYPPPNAFRAGLRKFWQVFGEALAAGRPPEDPTGSSPPPAALGTGSTERRSGNGCGPCRTTVRRTQSRA